MFMRLVCTIAILTLLTGAALRAEEASAQEINFDQINKFESLGTSTLHVGATETIPALPSYPARAFRRFRPLGSSSWRRLEN
jgi:hypothetical protein